MENKKVIVVGASSGIGAAIARQLLESGNRVALVARREEMLAEVAEGNDEALIFAHDVKEVQEVPELFSRITQQLKGLDCVIYAAGQQFLIGPNEFPTDRDREMVEVNLVGAIAWLNQAALRFSNTRTGCIVGISSVAGDRGRSGNPVYNATKAGLNTYLEALRNRLYANGVKVTTVKPGPVATPLTARLGLKPSMSADEAARKIIARAWSGREVYLKPAHAVIFYLIRRIPSWLFRRLNPK
ncbi:MAG: SDR family NAD(P)-dependent oxidoreductase [Fimbriimonadaceae bacterium]